MWIAQGLDDVGRAGVVGIHVCRSTTRSVIAERHKIDGVFQQRVIARIFDNHYAFFAEHAGRVGRIAATGLHVDKEQVLAVFFQRRPYVFGFTGVRVEIAARQHTAHLVLWVHLVGDFGRQRACHQLVVRRLILHLIFVFAFFEHQPGPGERAVQHNVDFVEGEPVCHQPIEFFKTGARIAGEEVDHLAVTPGAILGHQMHRDIEVTQRDQRLDVVLPALFEHRTIKRNPFFIRQRLVAIRVETAPGNRGTEYREAHLGH